ncbi:MAG: phospholipase D-like domain-containing protein [Clostridiales bacterium]|jgi:cardiolipin synthase|nr:phospholipase D-like domain-containing protein [Clostridiales bacterium]
MFDLFGLFDYRVLMVVNILCILSVVFIERKKPSETISWVLVITFLPGIGFALYLLIGETASMKMASKFGRKKLFDTDWRRRHAERMGHAIDGGGAGNIGGGGAVNAGGLASVEYNDMALMLDRQNAAALTYGNAVSIYTNAHDKYRALYADIMNAKKSVHLLYFTFNADHVGCRFIDLLAQKASEGVEVRLLYDTIGNFPYLLSHFKKIIRAGGQVYRFFPLVNVLKVNYRNHRKIAVIDGRIAYTGGINISKSYIGEHRRAKPWRDTHIRLVGPCVGEFQERFLLDWIYVSRERFDFDDLATLGAYFPAPDGGDAGAPAENDDMIPTDAENGDPVWDAANNGDTMSADAENGDAIPADAEIAAVPTGGGAGQVAVQVVSSGPDVEGEHIKYGYIKMINRAKRRLYMQSPYFIPDDAFMLALKLAVDSGVDVRIILPGIPDKRSVYVITRSYISELLRVGVRVYLYEGFIHSKMFLMDGEVASIGSANIDIRSFLLDFEINAFLYDRAFAKKCEDIFEDDIQHSKEVTAIQLSRNPFMRIAETLLRILSPLM